jgi:hypothetical protein
MTDSPLDDVERARLSDLLDELGPDAPTLLALWTTRDLAAHLVLRERDYLASCGSPAGSPTVITSMSCARESPMAATMPAVS